MKTERERIIEISVILIALFLFLIFVTLFIGLLIKPSFKNTAITGQAISIQSESSYGYNSNSQIISQQIYPNSGNCHTELIPYYDYQYDYKKVNYNLFPDNYDYRNDYFNKDSNPYSSYKAEKAYDGFYGNQIREYNVYVTNHGYETDLFYVRYYFEDYNGKEWTERVDHYIKPGQTEKFTIKDINNEPEKYGNWYYKVYSGLSDFNYDGVYSNYYDGSDYYQLQKYPVQKQQIRVVC